MGDVITKKRGETQKKTGGLNAARRGSKTTLLFKGTTGPWLQLGPRTPSGRQRPDATGMPSGEGGGEEPSGG